LLRYANVTTLVLLPVGMYEDVIHWLVSEAKHRYGVDVVIPRRKLPEPVQKSTVGVRQQMVDQRAAKRGFDLVTHSGVTNGF
jgi:hypothetical protein